MTPAAGIDQTASAGGGSRAIEASGARAVSAASLGGPAVAQGGVPALVAPAPASAAPWRSDMAALERQMRQEFAALRQSDLARAGGQVAAASVVNGDGASPRMSDQVLLQRIQQLIDQSEVRQQQNLALRVAEVSRDFDVQRRSDLVRIEQGFGRINDQREQDATQQRLMLNADSRLAAEAAVGGARRGQPHRRGAVEQRALRDGHQGNHSFRGWTRAGARRRARAGAAARVR